MVYLLIVPSRCQSVQNRDAFDNLFDEMHLQGRID